MTKVEPVNSWITLEPIQAEDKVGSLVVVTKDEGYKRGKVTALPYELDSKVKYIRVGNVVVYDVHGSVTVRIGDGNVTLVKANEILCVLREDEK